MAVGEPVSIYLDMGLGSRTEALRLQMGLELEGAGGLRVGSDGGRLRMGLCRRHGGLLKTLRVGDADGGGGLGVWPSIVWRTELICVMMQGKRLRRC